MCNDVWYTCCNSATQLAVLGSKAVITQHLRLQLHYGSSKELSLFALQCVGLQGQQRKAHSSPRVPALSDVTMASNLSALTFASDATTASMHDPNVYEKTSYYNGITGDSDHPDLVYRLDFLTTPFPKPVGRHASLPVKSLRGVFDTPLNRVWDAVSPQIRDLIKARKINWSVYLRRYRPREILTLLRKNGVDNVVVEWREAVLQRLAGPPLMCHVDSSNATHYVRRFLTALLGVPLSTKEMEDSQGTLTLWFHENKDKDGNPSNKVYGISNCHVLHKNTTVDYEHRGGAPMDHVRVCGMRRFQHGLDEIMKAIADRVILADLWTRDIVTLQAKERQDMEDAKAVRAKQRQLEDETEAIADLEAFHDKVTKFWANIKLHRNIGHVQYAAAILVDVGGGTLYTSDWAAFLAAEAKVSDEFEGNVVDLELDSEGQRCLIVGKDGNSTDLTVGRYAGLVSFILNEVGIESVELGIYNSGDKTTKVFSAKGDSGSLIWHTMNGKARVVGQLHSGHNKGGSTSNHVTYCTPGWYLLGQIKTRFKHADFYHTTWSA
ncbi:uncharacterized protein EI90DRAFT_3014028 [Cantharellus anzutake]|uniref:uncharacterized protein n=1 Tax=Cantharellus anzutake TaxID=1750568 RepID=UPI001903127E|nr:uncharacterized protein EI90DRAFT_3014028 [Cantharellus anzutake]KAF8337086.1 hypothetical protein EI90DRAFT_3014028 [Cantharellus anzutake]